jgi:hypothetical protein
MEDNERVDIEGTKFFLGFNEDVIQKKKKPPSTAFIATAIMGVAVVIGVLLGVVRTLNMSHDSPISPSTNPTTIVEQTTLIVKTIEQLPAQVITARPIPQPQVVSPITTFRPKPTVKKPLPPKPIFHPTTTNSPTETTTPPVIISTSLPPTTTSSVS